MASEDYGPIPFDTRKFVSHNFSAFIDLEGQMYFSDAYWTHGRIAIEALGIKAASETYGDREATVLVAMAYGCLRVLGTPKLVGASVDIRHLVAHRERIDMIVDLVTERQLIIVVSDCGPRDRVRTCPIHLWRAEGQDDVGWIAGQDKAQKPAPRFKQRLRRALDETRLP